MHKSYTRTIYFLLQTILNSKSKYTSHSHNTTSHVPRLTPPLIYIYICVHVLILRMEQPLNMSCTILYSIVMCVLLEVFKFPVSLILFSYVALHRVPFPNYLILRFPSSIAAFICFTLMLIFFVVFPSTTNTLNLSLILYVVVCISRVYTAEPMYFPKLS